MSWTWHWWVFIPGVVVFTIISLFSRGAMNASNIARHGPIGDYRGNIGGAIVGCGIAGAIYSAIATALIGFVL